MECGSHAHPVILQNSFTHTDTCEEIKGIVHWRRAVVFSLMMALLSSSVELLNSLPTNTHTHIHRGDYRAATQDTIIATENRFEEFYQIPAGMRKGHFISHRRSLVAYSEWRSDKDIKNPVSMKRYTGGFQLSKKGIIICSVF